LTHNLRLSVVCFALLDFSAGSKCGQESIVLIFLNLFLGQSTAASLGSLGLFGGNLRKFC